MRSQQKDYSRLDPGLFESGHRRRKANTAERVLRDKMGAALANARVLDVGSSTGWIGAWMAVHVRELIGADIDAEALAFSVATHHAANFHRVQTDAMRLPFSDGSFDVVLCMQMYEHVSDSDVLFGEIFRVLRPGGYCYFAADNRLQIIEPHYRLPLLSVVPRPLADVYLRLLGKGDFYYERLRTRAGLLALCKRFLRYEYTLRMFLDPVRFGFDYAVPPGSIKQRVACWVAQILPSVSPGFIWLLQKPDAE